MKGKNSEFLGQVFIPLFLDQVGSPVPSSSSPWFPSVPQFSVACSRLKKVYRKISQKSQKNQVFPQCSPAFPCVPQRSPVFPCSPQLSPTILSSVPLVCIFKARN